MAESEISLSGFALTKVHLHAPYTGVWFADCDFTDDAAGLKAGAATLKIGAAAFVGTLVAPKSGTFAGQKKIRLVGGAGGWSSSIKQRTYHNDAGVRASLLASDAAAAAGETLASFAGGTPTLSNDYFREAGEASRTIEDAARGAAWWVDYAGKTHVGPRPARKLTASAFTVLNVDPRHRNATLAIDAADAVQIGDSISDERLLKPLIVRSIEIVADAKTLRLVAWGGSGKQSLLVDSMRAMVKRMNDQQLFGKYRYRVLSMNGDRVDAQPVNPKLGLPNATAVPMWPGISGSHAVLTPGTHVTIEFLDGDRSLPVITSFTGRTGVNPIPVQIELGGKEGDPAARQGDTITAVMPPAVFVGTIVVGGVPSPATGAIIWSPPQIIGQISTGSSKVKVKT